MSDTSIPIHQDLEALINSPGQDQSAGYDIDLGDLEPRRLRIKIGGKLYVLNEPTAANVCEWNNAKLKATKLNEEGKVSSLDRLADTEFLLVSRCLFEALPTGEAMNPPRPVSETTLRSWPSRMQKVLFEKVKELGGLNEPETEADLKKQLASVQKKLDTIAAKQPQTAEDAAKN